MGRQGMSDEANPYYKADYRWSAPCRNVAGMVEAEAHDPGVNNGDSSGPAPQLSKNQQKKQRRQEAARQKLLAKKAKEKAARKASQEKKLAEREQRIVRMTEEERQAWDQRTQEKREARKQGERERKEKLQKALDSGQRIIIDLGFADRMTGAEIRSLCQQLAYSYSANTRAAQPAHLILTSYDGVMAEQICQHVSGFLNWLITKHQQSYLEAFESCTKDLVYLTADAEDELSELDPKCAYIIGGIVDRNRYKGLCRTKAETGGIRTARLPIGDYVKLLAAPVMTVNHCVAILVNYLERRDWQAAFEATVPQRKRAAASGEGGDLDIELEEGEGGKDSVADRQEEDSELDEQEAKRARVEDAAVEPEQLPQQDENNERHPQNAKGALCGA